MPSNDSVHTLANGHWEHPVTPSLASRALDAARAQLSKWRPAAAEPRTFVDLTTVESCVCRESDSAAQAARLMWKYDCRSLPVLGMNGELLGTVTDRDLCMAAYIKGQPLSEITLGDVLVPEVLSSRPSFSDVEIEQPLAAE